MNEQIRLFSFFIQPTQAVLHLCCSFLLPTHGRKMVFAPISRPLISDTFRPVIAFFVSRLRVRAPSMMPNWEKPSSPLMQSHTLSVLAQARVKVGNCCYISHRLWKASKGCAWCCCETNIKPWLLEPGRKGAGEPAEPDCPDTAKQSGRLSPPPAIIFEKKRKRCK